MLFYQNLGKEKKAKALKLTQAKTLFEDSIFRDLKVKERESDEFLIVDSLEDEMESFDNTFTLNIKLSGQEVLFRR